MSSSREIGNFGDANTTETPRIEHLFGREIKVYPNDELPAFFIDENGKKKENYSYKNWFQVNGINFIWKGDTHSQVPSNPADPNDDRLVETKTYEDFLKAIGDMRYGAVYDDEKNRFIHHRGLPRYTTYDEIRDHIMRFRKVKTGMMGKVQIPKGYSTATLKIVFKLLKAFDIAGDVADDDKSAEPTTAKKETIIEKKTRAKFKIDPAIEDWRKRAIKNGVAELKIDDNIDQMYRLCAINGHLNYPAYYTQGLAKLNYDEKVDAVKKDFEIYKKWLTTRETPPEWYEKMHDEGFVVESGTMKGERLYFPVVANDLKGTIDDWEVKITRIKDWTKKSGLTSLKRGADAIASFIKLSTPESRYKWQLEDQPVGSILSRRISQPTKASLGAELTDDEIQAGMKFLETGKRHIWATIEGKRVLVKDEKDTDPHYNTHLSIYKKWGEPYGELAPANMFFRLALSGTGWRKAEALTCKNKQISKETRAEENSGFYFKKDLCKVTFQTRKTERLGEEYKRHTSSIPPFSSKLIDSRHTIELIMKKFNQEKYESKNSVTRVRLSQDERIANRPQATFGKGKKSFQREAGSVSQVMIGYDNQFLPVNQIEKELGSDLKFNNAELQAYLYVPFKEMYSMMEHTGVTIRLPSEIKALREQWITGLKTSLRKKAEIFEMDKHGWAWKDKKGNEKSKEIQKVRQDGDRYDDTVQKYWAKKPLHSIRHVFAQTWLRKSEWNFGLVALVGHWKIIDTLKMHYGERDDDVAVKQIIELFSKSDKKSETDEIKHKLEGEFDNEDASELKKPVDTLSKSDKKKLESMGGVDLSGETPEQ